MNILQTIHTYWPQVGGAQIYVHNLSKILIEKGHSVTVFTHRLPGTPKKELIEGVQVRRFNVIPWTPYGIPHHRVQPYYPLAFLRHTNEFDLINFQMQYIFQTDSALPLKKLKLLQKPVIFSPIGFSHLHKTGWWVNRLYYRFWIPLMLKVSDKIIAWTQYEQITILKLYDIEKEKVPHIPPGIDFGKYEQLPSPELFKDRFNINNENMVLFVGNFFGNKAPDYLIKAIPSVLSENPDTIFVFVGWEGKKGYMKFCSDIAKKLQVNEHVLFTGPIKFTERELLLSAYRGADVLSMPSRWENFGLVLLEGLACETPFVAAYTGGTFELEQKKCGYGYKFSNISTLSKKLNHLLSDKKLAKTMGNHGRNVVRTEYDIRTVAERTEVLYNQVLSEYYK